MFFVYTCLQREHISGLFIGGVVESNEASDCWCELQTKKSMENVEYQYESNQQRKIVDNSFDNVGLHQVTVTDNAEDKERRK